MEQENNILFHITEDQAKKVCEYFGKNYKDLEEYEICELLDKLIDGIAGAGEIEPINF